MTIYILTGHIQWQGSKVLSVHRTEAGANAAKAVAEEERSRQQNDWVHNREPDRPYGPHVDNETYYVTEWTVED